MEGLINVFTEMRWTVPGPGSGAEMKKMKVLTALMVVGAVLIGAILLVPMSLATNEGASENGTSGANGDCTMDQVKDGTCEQCTGDQDMLRQQDRTKAQDGTCGSCPEDRTMLMEQDRIRANDGTCDGTDGICEPACDQVRERLQLQDGECSGQMMCAQVQSQEQSMAQTQYQAGTMSQVCGGKA